MSISRLDEEENPIRHQVGRARVANNRIKCFFVGLDHYL